MKEDNIIIICRHGERIDFSKERDNQLSNKGDPELTKDGINLSKYLGQNIFSEFKSLIEQNKIILYVSPFTRTLETAITLRNAIQHNLDNTNQELIIYQNLGECNIYNYDLYPNVLYYNKDKKQKDEELFNELIISKMNQGKIKYEIKHVKGFVKHPESIEESDVRYVKSLKIILDELKNKKSNLVIIVTHGEGVSACCKYLSKIIKEKSEDKTKKLYPNFFNNITGYNQNYCNSFCFRVSKSGENISYYDELCYRPEFEIDSEILLFDNDYKNKLINWLKNPNNNKPNENKNIKYILLLYRGSRDGFQAKTFHEKCDNKGETLTIIESKDGFIFGGYTEINWDSTIWNGKIGENNNSRREGNGNEFVFTLKNPHGIKPSKYNMKKSFTNHSICCDGNLGPIFGCNDIRIEDNCNINENKFSFFDFQKGEYCFNDSTGKKRLLFTGNTSFLVKEIEVFNIIR